MTVKEKRELSVMKRCQRIIALMIKVLDNLRIAQDNVSFESAESYLLSKAIRDISEARSNLEVVVSRITNKQKGIHYD